MVSKEELAELCDARDKLCGYCGEHEGCELCDVYRIVSDAFDERIDD